MKDLYQSAFQYLNTELWKTLWDNQLFAVKFSNGEIGYCCVMGAAGEFCGLGIYIGDEGINSYLNMASGEFSSIDETEIKFPNKLFEIIKKYGKPKKNNSNRFKICNYV